MVKFDFDATGFLTNLREISLAKQTIMPKVFQTFYSATPVKSGNAKSNTTLTSKNDIQANYAYADVLDAGRGFRDGRMRGSPQAPKGMTDPAIKTMEFELNKFIAAKAKNQGAK
jgi:hypothetical protein